MRKIFLYILFLSIIGCVSLEQNRSKLSKNYTNTKIVKILFSNISDSIYYNELRFHLSSAFYTEKYLYDRFGHWDKVAKKGKYNHYLIWENCKLFEGNDNLFDVAASGLESREEMYSAVMIWDKDNKDVLSEKSSLKDTLVSMFYYGTKKTKLNKDKFFLDFWIMRGEHRK
ncbi:MAG: hypothetical protein HQ471_00220 [Flavobacteriales bacterium]|jgi:hypothetical protein|nr:hypothetical protein [Flavobacteriales bacterium]